jgi:hypothetical protein
LHAAGASVSRCKSRVLIFLVVLPLNTKASQSISEQFHSSHLAATQPASDPKTQKEKT